MSISSDAPSRPPRMPPPTDIDEKPVVNLLLNPAELRRSNRIALSLIFGVICGLIFVFIWLRTH